MLAKILKKIQVERLLSHRVRDGNWRSKLRYYGLQNQEIFCFDGNLLDLAQLDLTGCDYSHAFILEGYRYAISLKSVGAQFSTAGDAKLLITLGHLSFVARNKQELYILAEIFVERCYNYIFVTPSIVVDVGFNVGFASVFFASSPLVSHIFAFEPYPKTFEIGLETLTLNPEIAGRVSVFNYGLGIKNETFRSVYDENRRGDNAARPSTDTTAQNTVHVSIREISEVLEELEIFSRERFVVLKLDCEGWEHDLIPHLENKNLLSKFDVIMIEWHGNSPSNIEQILKDKAYHVFSLRSSKNLGVIYACKGFREK